MRPKPKAKISRTRLPFLEGIRGLAALYVVLGHISTLSDPSTASGRTSHSPSWLQSTMGSFSYGHLAVAAFIVISGFCLELSLFARGDGALRSIKRFYMRRAQRILPPYYACLALSVVVAVQITAHQIGSPFNQYLPVDGPAILSHVFMVHNFSTEWMYKINGVLWSIAIEFQLYFLFPLIVLGINKLGRPMTLALCGLAVFGLIQFIPHATKLYFWYLGLFAVGMVAASLALKPGKAGRWPVIASLLALGCIYGGYYAEANTLGMLASDLFVGGAIACACYSMTCAPRGPLYRFLVLKPIVGLGAFSYSLYLMHHPIAQVLYAYRPNWAWGEVSLFFYFVACLPIILFSCWVFYWLFERPFMPKPAKRLVPKTGEHAPAGLPLRVYGPNGSETTQKATASASLKKP